MKIGIIGAGNIGSNLARRLTAVGHEVRIANSRDPETLSDLAQETGAIPVFAGEAARGAEVVVVTIPLKAVADLPGDILADAAPSVAVIDTNNYYPQRDGRIAAIEDDGLTESQWVARELGHTVVKAFNGFYARNIVELATPSGASGRVALPVAGDDADAKAKVMALVDEIGFEPVDAGTLADSWRQEPGSPSYGPTLDAQQLQAALADATPERPEDFRA